MGFGKLRFRRSFGQVKSQFRGAIPKHFPIAPSQAQDYFDRLDTAGDTTYTTYKQPLANYIDGLVSSVTWTNLYSSASFAGVGIQGVVVPLKSGAPVITNHNLLVGDLSQTDGLNFDGSTQYISTPFADTDFTTAGSISIQFAPTIGAEMTLVSFSDSGTTNNYVEIGVDALGAVYIESNDGGTIDVLKTITTLADAVSTTLTVTYDGSVYIVAIDGEQEPVLDNTTVGTAIWFDSVTGGDVLTIGATTTSGGTANYFSGDISTYLITADELI